MSAVVLDGTQRAPRAATPAFSTDPSDAVTAAEQWRALSPLLAARPKMRVSRDGGRNYHQRWERNLTEQVPQQPAAVHLYTASGECRVLIVDLDSARGGVDAVQRDAAAIERTVGRAGGRLIRDHSPNGGVHLYVPLAEPVSFHQARDLALALATRTPTMDPSPNHNLIAGLIRPPGARHRTGGFQILDGSLTAAYQLARTGNPPTVFTALQQEFAAELKAMHGQATLQPESRVPADAEPGQPGDLTRLYAQIARTGTYDTTRYRSPSEARQAVITSAAAAGIPLSAVLHKIEAGVWPGLAAFYTRYRPGARTGAVTRDYRTATAWINRKQQTVTSLSHAAVRKSHTSGSHSHGGPPGVAHSGEHDQTLSTYQWLRQWENSVRAIELQRYPGRAGYGIRFLLRALGEAARKQGTRKVEFGVRSLAIATAQDHGTIAGYLRRLRDEPEPFIALVQGHAGLDADTYELVIPESELTRATNLTWRSGLTHALRPAFRELGQVAALLYEVLEHSPTALSTTELIERTQISRSATHDALETLAAFNLVRPDRGRWVHHPGANLNHIAERFGCIDATHQQMTRYAAERIVWRALVMSGRYLDGEVIIDPGDWLPWPEPPPDDQDALFDLVDIMMQNA